jgi:hypothetical protein
MRTCLAEGHRCGGAGTGAAPLHYYRLHPPTSTEKILHGLQNLFLSGITRFDCQLVDFIQQTFCAPKRQLAAMVKFFISVRKSFYIEGGLSPLQIPARSDTMYHCVINVR